jgi:UDP-N-acetyl-D-glucosamine dehydrogenase
MNIAVIGMGKIGLPLAVHYARKGNKVIGVDINPETVALINEGIEPFPEEKNLKEYLQDVVEKGNLNATLKYREAVCDADVVVVVVPLFVTLTGEPDFAAMDSASEKIGQYLKAGSLICYETTLPIGTTRMRLTPILEKNSQKKAGQDFHVVFSPERVLTGRIFEDLKKYPKIVGGFTNQCAQKGFEFYNDIIDFDLRNDLEKPNGVWTMQNCDEAEFVKLAETTYRDVNIGLVNQFARFSEKNNMNIYNVIEAANSQPYSHLHNPGISVGGHCIPIYPQFYMWKDKDASIIRTAREFNEEVTSIILDSIIDGNKQNFLIFGLSYRTGVKEVSFSGAHKIINKLVTHGIEYGVYDINFSSAEIEEMGYKPAEHPFKNYTHIVIHTYEQEYLKIIEENLKSVSHIYDGRNCLSNEFVRRLNSNTSLHVFGIGR